MEAVDQLQGDIDVIDLRTIVPWDVDMVMESVRRTGRCVIVHEDCITAGFGAEISARVTDECFNYLDAPVRRCAVADIPVPYNKGLMAAVVPTTETVIAELKALLAW
jgi:2-oxoisovalerate dehydrogenase E1 component